MAGRKRLFKGVRFVYRPSSLLLKCAVLAVIVLSTAALLTLRGSILYHESRTDHWRAQAASLEQDNRRLEGYLAELGTVQSVKRIASEKLGLVDPDTVLFDPVN